MTDELRGVPPEGGPPDDVLEKIVGEALYFEYPGHPAYADIQRKIVLEAVAKIRTALRGVPPTEGQTDREWLADRFVAAIAGRDSEKFTKGFRIAGELVSDVVGEEFGRLIAERDNLRALRQPFVEVRTTACHAGSDGECNWSECPQLRDDEPEASGRHCPLDAIPQVHTGAVPPTEEK